MTNNIDNDARTPEEELLDMVVAERVSYLLEKFPEETEEEQEDGRDLIQDAEEIMDSLPEEQQEIMKEYVEQLISQQGTQQAYLYREGVKDGIRIMKKLKAL